MWINSPAPLSAYPGRCLASCGDNLRAYSRRQQTYFTNVALHAVLWSRFYACSAVSYRIVCIVPRITLDVHYINIRHAAKNSSAPASSLSLWGHRSPLDHFERLLHCAVAGHASRAAHGRCVWQQLVGGMKSNRAFFTLTMR